MKKYKASVNVSKVPDGLQPVGYSTIRVACTSAQPVEQNFASILATSKCHHKSGYQLSFDVNITGTPARVPAQAGTLECRVLSRSVGD